MQYLVHFIFFTLSIVRLDHDIHVGVVEVDIDTDRVQITIKTFLDDLQLACGLQGGHDLPEGYTSAEDLISRYIENSVQIKLNDTILSLPVGEVAAAQDAVWITLESAPLTVQNVSNVTIHCDMLTDIYDDQQNIVKITWGSSQKSKVLDQEETSLNWRRP